MRPASRTLRRALVALIAPGLALAACGGSESLPANDDRGAGVGALGAGARVETLARARLAMPAPGRLARVADEYRLAPGVSIEHRHEFAFAYGRRGTQTLTVSGDELPVGEAEGAVVKAGALHRHDAAEDEALLWEIRLARPGSRAPRGRE